MIPATSANGTGILGIKVIRSNIAEYDKSDSSHYFCTIKGRNAELYTSTHDVGIGDLIELNSDTEEMIFFKPDGKTDVVEMKLYSSDRFYENFVRKNSKL